MNENVVNLLKRAALAIESDDFDRAEEFLDKALDADAECSEAYFGLLLCDRCCKNEDELIDLAVPVDNDKNFEFALRFAEGDKKERMVVKKLILLPCLIKKQMVLMLMVMLLKI